MGSADADQTPPLLAGVFGAWNARGVRWCLLRGAARLSDGEGDVDVLVHPADLREALGVAREQGFARVPAWGHGPHRFLVGLDDGGRRWVRLDLVDRVVFGQRYELDTTCAEGVLERAGARDPSQEPLRVPAADDAFWLLFLHCALDAGALEPKHRGELAALAGLPIGTEGPVGSEPRVRGIIDRIGLDPVDRAKSGDWVALDELILAARAVDPPVRGPLGLARLGRLSIARRARPLLSLTRRKGVAVALLGPDGAGKSTLSAILTESYPLPARSVYAGLYPAGARERYRVPGLNFATRVARMRAAAAAAAWHRLRGRLVVVDRHPLDALLSTGGRQSRKASLRRQILARTGPRVDLVVVLDAPVEVLLARKREHPREVIEAQRDAYSRLAERTRGAIVVDVTAELDAVSAAIRKVIWAEQARRLGAF